MKTYFPGTRVLVFNPTIYKDDKSTPLAQTIQPATVIMWYGQRSYFGGNDGNLVTVKFDHDGRISPGHFADHMKTLS